MSIRSVFFFLIILFLCLSHVHFPCPFLSYFPHYIVPLTLHHSFFSYPPFLSFHSFNLDSPLFFFTHASIPPFLCAPVTPFLYTSSFYSVIPSSLSPFLSFPSVFIFSSPPIHPVPRLPLSPYSLSHSLNSKEWRPIRAVPCLSNQGKGHR